ncbi:hypothetical protein EW145_g823 [Phellinidium pouzarii]|uniref:Uncharacterized protein n=1 Tax=Phellinidium pouzarii TaxID=167371 RepID=A0A4S4LH46_9AGAM|nr:hypothetical protein EW145_g823 [Phellinidium pouzarii]
MSYFTPPPTAGVSWSQTVHHPRTSHSASPMQSMGPGPGAPLPTPSPSNVPQHPNMHNPMFAMMAMMQQMQSLPQNYPQQPAQPQLSTPALEPQMPVPQASDNSLIAQILYEQTKRGLTYKAALESLHGHNGIAAYAWKDYFLENKQVVDDLVNKLKIQASVAARVKPESQDVSRVRDSHHRDRQEIKRRRSYSREAVPRKEKLTEAMSAPVVKVKIEKDTTDRKLKAKAKTFENEGSSRRTLNSLSSTPSQSLLALIPSGVPIDPYTGLPAAPPRSPSPPVANPGQKYTDQDDIFFFKRIAYDLARNPDLSKANLCDILAEKAPHHSALSWRTYWVRKEDVADKMVLLTQLDEEDRKEVIRSWKTGKSVSANGVTYPRKAPKVTYKESSSSESSRSVSESAYSDGDSDNGDEDAVGSTDDDEELGEAGSPFTIAEIRALAKYIVTVHEYWYDGHKEWGTFCSAHTQRTPASWKEFYRRRATGTYSDDMSILS